MVTCDVVGKGGLHCQYLTEEITVISEMMLDGKGGTMGESVKYSFVVNVCVDGVGRERYTLRLEKESGNAK